MKNRTLSRPLSILFFPILASVGLPAAEDNYIYINGTTDKRYEFQLMADVQKGKVNIYDDTKTNFTPLTKKSEKFVMRGGKRYIIDFDGFSKDTDNLIFTLAKPGAKGYLKFKAYLRDKYRTSKLKPYKAEILPLEVVSFVKNAEDPDKFVEAKKLPEIFSDIQLQDGNLDVDKSGDKDNPAIFDQILSGTYPGM